MKRMSRSWLAALMVLMLALVSRGQTTAPTLTDAPAIQAFYDQARPALVAVKYQWEGEFAQQEVVAAGVVVNEQGLVMVPLTMVTDALPESQMKDFKILVPSDTQDPEEVDATFVGRDDRSDLGFVQAKDSSRKWPFIHFQDQPTVVGQKVFSIGLLPKAAGYKAYLTEGSVAANLRGEQPQVLTSGGGVATVGGVVFDETGDAIGWVLPQTGQETFLDSNNALANLLLPARFFVPTRFFALSLADPPKAGKPLQIPWEGITAMTGVTKEVADFLQLKNQPAIQVGDIAAGGPADMAGVKANDIIVAMNGKPLERGDVPKELPFIMRRKVSRMNVGDRLTLTILREKDKPTQDLTLILRERPPLPSSAQRYYASDLGFVAREAVFQDRYLHRVKGDAPAIVIDLVKPDGAAATAKLMRDDLVLQMNGTAVHGLYDFKLAYEQFRQNNPHDPVVLVVDRAGGREETINIEAPAGTGTP